jgi:hypothetical protein
MLRARHRGFGLLALTLSTLACGGQTHDEPMPGLEGGSRATGGAAGASETGGTTGTTRGGSASSGSPSGGSASGGVTACGGLAEASDTVDLARAVAGASARGCGECSGRTLGELVALVQDDYPELAQLATFYEPSAPGADGDLIYAFEKEDGFRLIFSKGDGDCESGCIDHEYWYVETASFCYPYTAGHYARTYQAGGNCFHIEGEPLWGFPAASHANSCDLDDVPGDVSGAHFVTARGDESKCNVESVPAMPVVFSLVLRVTQSASDPKHATVRVEGSGNASLDGADFEGELSGSELTVSVDQTPTDAQCIDTMHLTLRYDFELASGNLILEEAHTPNCEDEPDEYCKGYLRLDLGP